MASAPIEPAVSEPPGGAPAQASESAEVSQQVIGRSPWELFWRRFRQDRFAFAGIVVIAIMVILALAAPLTVRLTGHGPNQPFVYETLDEFGLPRGPHGQFWFGSDTAGRDLFVRVIYGARTSLVVAFFVALLLMPLIPGFKGWMAVQASLVIVYILAAQGVSWPHAARHMMGLRNGQAGARHWRQVWSDHRRKADSAREVSRAWRDEAKRFEGVRVVD